MEMKAKYKINELCDQWYKSKRSMLSTMLKKRVFLPLTWEPEGR